MLGQTRLFEWLVSIDDGTIDKKIMTFEVAFKALSDCSETAL